MTVEKALNLTRTRLFFGDMLLNWFLGVVLLAIPSMVDGLLALEPLLPIWAYRLIGAAFLGFAAWQLGVVRSGKLSSASLIFAALLAEIPVLLLTAGLVWMSGSLRVGWRIVLWGADLYMLLLGAWYLFLARWQMQYNDLSST